MDGMIWVDGEMDISRGYGDDSGWSQDRLYIPYDSASREQAQASRYPERCWTSFVIVVSSGGSPATGGLKSVDSQRRAGCGSLWL